MSKKVFIVLETARQPGRSQLIGILRGINAGRLDWEIDIVPSRRKASTAAVKRALSARADGVILAHPVGPGVPEQLQRQGKPTVFMDVLSQSNIPTVPTSRYLRVDDAAIGRAAARHFLSLGNFRSFAFVHDPRDEIWTRERQAAFVATLAEAEHTCKTFTSSAAAAETAAPHTGGARLSRPHELPTFLRRLPLPAAVLAASDLVAADVLHACETANLAIPDDVAVLGVDNDIGLCNRLVPRLSSIEPDFEEEGFRAVIALENLFGNKIEIDDKPLADVRLVERESTKPLPPATRLVDRALAFIDGNYRTPITPRDVARQLGVSRRLIDLRFRQLQHETLLATINKRRLEALCKMLREESGSMRDLIAACGFGSAVRAAHLFKSTYGISMSGYRSKCRNMV
jgi:LacI family transcriptional regulator